MSRKQYPFDLIEPKWQARWDAEQTFRAWNPGEEIPSTHPFAARHGLAGKASADQLPRKFYILDMFPYPSGAGLHVGHPEGYTATDILARYRRAQGLNVLHPMGWDSFGLPAEQYAVKTGQHPRKTTDENIANFTRQIKSLGFSYDWSREVATTDPEYFRWTQWIFLKLYNSYFDPSLNKAMPISLLEDALNEMPKLQAKWEISEFLVSARKWAVIPERSAERIARIRKNFADDHRLAYVSEAPVNWCPELGTVLANEEVIDGKSEVGGFPVIRRPMRQWMLRITAFAEKLLADLDTIDWSDSLKEMQRNWIGRSEGAEVDFALALESPSAALLQNHLQEQIRRFELTDALRQAAKILIANIDEHGYLGATIEELSSSKSIPVETIAAALKHVQMCLPAGVGARDLRECLLLQFEREHREATLECRIVRDFMIDLGKRQLLEIARSTGEDFSNVQAAVGRIGLMEPRPGRAFVSTEKIRVFTTRPDTLFGATYMVLSPEHKLVDQIVPDQWPTGTPLAWKGKSSPHRPSLSEDQLASAARQFGVELVTLSTMNIPPDVIAQIPAQVACKYRVVPLAYRGNSISIAISDPTNLEVIDAVFGQLKWELDVKVASATEIDGALARYYGAQGPSPWEAVETYRAFAAGKSDLERTELAKDKTGVFTGAYAINPANGEKIPIWIADYVLASYGTGAIMAVPAHDERDFEFAKKFKLPIKIVVVRDTQPGGGAIPSGDMMNEAWVTEGTAIFSPNLDGYALKHGHLADRSKYCDLNGLPTQEAKKKITAWLEEKGVGKKTINYKLRDWLFSRQRYWGEPFPIVWKKDSAGNLYHEALPESALPLLPPTLEDYKPTAEGQPPLARAKDWVNLPDGSVRETNTMPQWAGSCWYYLRYLDAKNASTFVGKDVESYWMAGAANSKLESQNSNLKSTTPGVDLYVGGTEHAVLHLLYARFWHKVLFDLGYVTTAEPFYKLVNQGLILGEDGQKMSKARGNVVNPDEVVREFGADSLRLYEMFMGPLQDTKPWNTRGVEGVYRFLGRVWRFCIDEKSETAFEQAETTCPPEQRGELLDLILLDGSIQDISPTPEQLKVLHTCIRKVTDDLEHMRFNTAISAMMVFINEANGWQNKPLSVMKPFLQLLAPFAPHIAEELWARLHGAFGQIAPSLTYAPWPKFDASLLVESTLEIPVQVNGKLRDKLVVPADISNADLEKAALASEKVQPFLTGKQIKKVIVVPRKLVNIAAA